MATVERLKRLRDQFDIRSADKLRKAALANGLRPKAADLVAALQGGGQAGLRPSAQV